MNIKKDRYNTIKLQDAFIPKNILLDQSRLKQENKIKKLNKFSKEHKFLKYISLLFFRKKKNRLGINKKNHNEIGEKSAAGNISADTTKSIFLFIFNVCIIKSTM